MIAGRHFRAMNMHAISRLHGAFRARDIDGARLIIIYNDAHDALIIAIFDFAISTPTIATAYKIQRVLRPYRHIDYRRLSNAAKKFLRYMLSEIIMHEALDTARPDRIR